MHQGRPITRNIPENGPDQHAAVPTQVVAEISKGKHVFLVQSGEMHSRCKTQMGLRACCGSPGRVSSSMSTGSPSTFVLGFGDVQLPSDCQNCVDKEVIWHGKRPCCVVSSHSTAYKIGEEHGHENTYALGVIEEHAQKSAASDGAKCWGCPTHEFSKRIDGATINHKRSRSSDKDHGNKTGNIRDITSVFTMIKVEGRKFEVCLDTGSGYNFMSWESYKEICLKLGKDIPIYQWNRGALRTANSQSLNVIGYVSVQVKITGKVVLVELACSIDSW